MRRCVLECREKTESARAESLRIAMENPLCPMQPGCCQLEAVDDIEGKVSLDFLAAGEQHDRCNVFKRVNPVQAPLVPSCTNLMEVLDLGESLVQAFSECNNAKLKSHRLRHLNDDVVG